MQIEISEFRGLHMTRAGSVPLLSRPPLVVHRPVQVDAGGAATEIALHADASLVRLWSPQEFLLRVDGPGDAGPPPHVADGRTERFPAGDTTIGVRHNDGGARLVLAMPEEAGPTFVYQPKPQFAAAAPGTSLAEFGWTRVGRPADSWRPVTTGGGGIGIVEEAEANAGETIWTRAVEAADGELRFTISSRAGIAANERGELRMLLACAGIGDYLAIHVTTGVGAYEIIRRQSVFETTIASDSVGEEGFARPVPFTVRLDEAGIVSVRVPDREPLIQASGMTLPMAPAIGIAAKSFGLGRNVLVDDLRFAR